MKSLLVAPGVSRAGTSHAYLDFARTDNIPTDILYLSGHGSVAGSITGEAGDQNHEPRDVGYMSYLRVLDLLQSREAKLTQHEALMPLAWIVIAACFNMPPALAEVWLRLR